MSEFTSGLILIACCMPDCDEFVTLYVYAIGHLRSRHKEKTTAAMSSVESSGNDQEGMNRFY